MLSHPDSTLWYLILQPARLSLTTSPATTAPTTSPERCMESFSDRARQPPLTTYEGCKHFCGPGTQYYAWADISSTITTWVMVTARFFSQHPLILCLQVFPVVGLLLQAPFESNKDFSTLLALARWLGNPIAGMSCTFWNIRIIGRCALMVDMAPPYDEVPDPGSHFAQIRDSLYLLSIMNQCTYLRGLIS